MKKKSQKLAIEKKGRNPSNQLQDMTHEERLPKGLYKNSKSQGPK